MIENTTNLTNTTNWVNTTVLIDLLVAFLAGVFLIILKWWFDMKYKNYPKRKKEHIDRLTKNILNKWKNVTCEPPRNFAINRNFLSLNGYNNIRKHSDFDYAVEHIKKYPCWIVWERIMGSFNNLNSYGSNILNELNKEISYRLNGGSFTSDIIISQSHIILDAVVKIVIDNSDKNLGCDAYVHIETKEKWVQTDVGTILAEGGDIQDLDAFKQIICGLITSEHYQKKIRVLCLQYKSLKKGDMKTFTDQLSGIASLAEHTSSLKGMCKACPRVLWVFTP